MSLLDSINWDDVEEPKPLTPDDYHVTIETAMEKTSQAGNPMISAVLTTDENRKLFHNWSLLPQCQGFFKRDMKAFGFDAIPDDIDLLEGKTAIAKVVNKTNDDVISAKIASFKRA